MFILVIFINFLSIFCFICSINTIRTRYKLNPSSGMESIYYKTSFTTLNILSLGLCLYCWNNPGWLIWINLTSINAMIVALCLGFYPQFYIKWITSSHSLRKSSH